MERRLEPGDEVLDRHAGRFLVRNPSLGRWQITRETLRHLHRSYLKDSRDYSRPAGSAAAAEVARRQIRIP
jgi:hypothetical protein